MNIFVKRFIQLTLVAATSTVILACSSDSEDLCDLICRCNGAGRCSDGEYQDCVDNHDHQMDRAANYNCDDRLQALWDCQIKDDRCDYPAYCSPEARDYANCMGPHI